MSLLESVPNFSTGTEGGRRLAEVAGASPGVALLDWSADEDHNRAVLTLAGEPDPLHRALSALYELAVGELDLRRHRGVHPRVGVVDVTPFIPLPEDTPERMGRAIAAARRLGAEVGERFSLPVFLYEEAATGPHRRDLARIRRGGLAALGARMAEDPAWRPDFGPPRPHPTAGATVIGARRFLIAFNARLATTDVAVARRIAARVRESGGGLPALKAIGVYLGTRRAAQVSMNLVDFRRTPPARALEAVRREAARLGTEVTATEIIGLVPRAALAGTTPEELGLEGFSPDRVLEHRLRLHGLA